MNNNASSFRTQFKYRMRNLRLSKAMTQEAFASFLGLSRPTIGFYERADKENGRVPDAETLQHICKKCEVSADYLLGLSDRQAVTEISAYTGLSPEAVECLHQMSLWPSLESLALLEYLITLQPFQDLLFHLNRYLTFGMIKTNTLFRRTPEYADCKKLLESQGFRITVPSTEANEYYFKHVIPTLQKIMTNLNESKLGFMTGGGSKNNRTAKPESTGESDGEHQKD